MVYNYLFYKGYQLAQKSKNWEDTPILFAVMVIGWCFILNVATIFFLLEGVYNRNLGIGNVISSLNKHRYLFASVLSLLILIYYTYGSRWRRIIAKYEAKEKERGRNIHPAIVVIAAYVLSFVLGMLSAMYKNGDGLFG